MTDRDPGITPSPPTTQTVLAYESTVEPEVTGPRPKWVYAVLGIYSTLTLGVLTSPVWGNWAANENVVVPASIAAVVLVLCGLTLMILPARVARRRNITRRSIWFPVIASGLFAGSLVMAGLLGICELLKLADDPAGWAVIVSGCAVWIAWSVIFMLMAKNRGPQSIGLKLHRALILGSVAELLVAVPTHIIVRRRDECCAGILTGMAICVGVAVMFIAFGPSVLLLYYRRGKQISNR